MPGRPFSNRAGIGRRTQINGMKRIFLLSPASCGGRRASLLFNDNAQFDLARAIRQRRGATLGEVFSFLSGLYFRGKLTYASAFAQPPRGARGVLIITPSRGLVPPEARVRLSDLHELASVPIDLSEPQYLTPLQRDTQALAARVTNGCEIVLLGSVATDKYVRPLTDAFGDRLRFPAEFVGRGDMSRGGLLLRCVDAGRQLTYVPLEGAVRHGARPPRLEKRVSAR
jgi:hypothetical protein